MIRLPTFPKPSIRRVVVAGLACAILLPISAAWAAEEAAVTGELGQARDESAPHDPSHILVKVAAPTATARTLATGTDELGAGWFEVPVPAGWEPIDWAEEMASRPGVEMAELDLILTKQAAPPFVSPDPLYANSADPRWQWHLHAANVGTAWLSTVGAGVTVAVLDTGVNEGTDGFCRPFVAEYNAVSDVAGPGAALDTDGHGSHVAGSVAQCSDNDIEGAGMAPEASVMPVKVFQSSGGANTSDVARGIDWAVANGARVINMSLGCSDCGGSTTLNAAIDRASAAGAVIVVSSGNSPVDVFYPANHPSVLGVGAITRSGNVANYSARGLGLDLVAPGGEASNSPTTFIWQDTLGGYEGFAGTSMAAGHVSGAAALLISRFPNAPAVRVKNAITCSAVNLGAAGWDEQSGFGRLDAGRAVEQLRLMMEAGTASCVGQAASIATYAAIQTNAGFWRLHQGSSQTAGFHYGNPGDFGFMGDWDCDGIDTPGLYRQSDGYVYLRNSNTQGVADVAFFFGNPGDLPLAGDFDGDGCDTVSIYRPSEGRFYIIDRLGSGDQGLGRASSAFYFGDPGDAPFMGDWDGDGIDTPGLRRPSTGFVYLRHSNSQGIADIDYFYGDPGDVVFTGDWDKDGDDTLGLYRPSTGTVYLRNTNSTGVAHFTFGVGGGMQAVGGDF
jgi:Subtilase family